jgi:hypothetical protein
MRSSEGSSKRRIGAARRTDHFARVVNLHESAGPGHSACVCALVLVLKRHKDISVGQPHIGVRMHVARHVGERGDDLRMQRIAHIENERPPGKMVVGKNHSARGHQVFGVVDLHCLLVGADRGHEVPVVR